MNKVDLKSMPWYPPEYELADISAIKGVAAGTATEEQQKRAMKWIIENCCATYEMSYRPTSDRDTAFAEGRRFVGSQIVKLIKLDMSIFKRDKQ